MYESCHLVDSAAVGELPGPINTSPVLRFSSQFHFINKLNVCAATSVFAENNLFPNLDLPEHHQVIHVTEVISFPEHSLRG